MFAVFNNVMVSIKIEQTYLRFYLNKIISGETRSGVLASGLFDDFAQVMSILNTSY